MSPAPASELCFMSPTYSGDFDRFVFLRESICAFGQGQVPHYALVDTEEKAQLEQLRLPNVHAVTTAELLGPEVERRRLAYKNSGGRTWKRWQRSLNKRLGWFPSARYYGWQIQQLLKLAAPAQLPHRVFVNFDSDLVATGRFDESEFLRDGKAALFETRFTLESGQNASGWYGNACRLLDQPAPVRIGDEFCEYVSQPFVFEQGATRALHAWLEKRYSKSWWRCLVDLPLGDWSEFMIYGVFARRHLNYEGMFLREANASSLWIEYEPQFREAEQLIRRAFEDPKYKFLCLQADDHQKRRLEQHIAQLRDELARKSAGAAGNAL